MCKNKRIAKIVLPLLIILALTPLYGCAQELAPETPGIDATAWAGNLRKAALDVSTDLRDKYATYYSPAEYQQMLENFNGSFAGVGIYMDQNEQGQVEVVSVMPGRPAEAAGLEAGDIILAVDGTEVTGVNLDDVMMRLRGEEGTQVNVDLLHQSQEGETRYSVTITRSIIETDSLSGDFLTSHPGIAYINIYDFTERTPHEFYDLLQKLYAEQDILGLILDLRNNGGGSFGAAIGVANFFVPSGEPIVWEKVYGGELVHRSDDGSLSKLPLVCLQNEYTASASEVLIGALKDYGNTTVVGTVSYGKGITQVVEQLPDGSGIKYTRSRYYTPLRYDLHGKGIVPDITVDTPENITYEEYFDPNNENNIYIEQALKALDERIHMQVL